jgi:hypothetical protein
VVRSASQAGDPVGFVLYWSIIALLAAFVGTSRSSATTSCTARRGAPADAARWWAVPPSVLGAALITASFGG